MVPGNVLFRRCGRSLDLTDCNKFLLATLAAKTLHEDKIDYVEGPGSRVGHEAVIRVQKASR